MPVSTLNRIVSMFIVGGVPIVWYVLRGFPLPPDSPVLTGFILIPISAFFGVAAEGAANFWRQFAIHPTSDCKELAESYGQQRQFEKLQLWRGRLKQLLDEREKRVTFAIPPVGPSALTVDDYASGVALRKGSKEQVDWINAHHSAYMLASALTVMVFAVGVVELPHQLCAVAIYLVALEVIIVLGLCYLMTCFGANMWLYSYVLTCRFATLRILDPDT